VELVSALDEIRAPIFNYNSIISAVDKVVIAQESFSRLINTISPGAYTSMTKISFTDLDKSRLRPTGVYGSRDELVKLMRTLGAVNDELFVLVQSGLMILKLI
jgi:hypothetical protein